MIKPLGLVGKAPWSSMGLGSPISPGNFNMFVVGEDSPLLRFLLKHLALGAGTTASAPEISSSAHKLSSGDRGHVVD